MYTRTYKTKDGSIHTSEITTLGGMPANEYHAAKAREYRERQRQRRIDAGDPPQPHRRTNLSQDDMQAIREESRANKSQRYLMAKYHISYGKLHKVLSSI